MLSDCPVFTSRARYFSENWGSRTHFNNGLGVRAISEYVPNWENFSNGESYKSAELEKIWPMDVEGPRSMNETALFGITNAIMDKCYDFES